MVGYDLKRVEMNAKRLNVSVLPSTRKHKKLDVFKDGKKVGSIGHKNYLDYTAYIHKIGKKEADKKEKII